MPDHENVFNLEIRSGRWINENDLNDLTLLTSEPGYLTYQTRNPVIDGAGLVTKNLSVEGSGGQRLRKLVEVYEPDLVVTSARSFRKSGDYTPLYHTLNKTLYISDKTLRRRAEASG